VYDIVNPFLAEKQILLLYSVTYKTSAKEFTNKVVCMYVLFVSNQIKKSIKAG